MLTPEEVEALWWYQLYTLLGVSIGVVIIFAAIGYFLHDWLNSKLTYYRKAAIWLAFVAAFLTLCITLFSQGFGLYEFLFKYKPLTPIELRFVIGEICAGLTSIAIQIQLQIHQHSIQRTIDDRDREIAQLKASIARLSVELEYGETVGRAFLQNVSTKWSDLDMIVNRKCQQHSIEPTELVEILETLNPNMRIIDLIYIYFHLLQVLFKDELKPNPNEAPKEFGLTLFQVMPGKLVATAVFQGSTVLPPDTFCNDVDKLQFSHKDLKKKNYKSAAVKSYAESIMVVVPDTSVEKDCKKACFSFFSPDQKNIIKSFVAMPLGETTTTESCKFVLCIHINRPGFFTELLCRQHLATLTKHFAVRLLYENSLSRIMLKLSKTSKGVPISG